VLRFFYTMLLTLAAPLLFARAWWRGRREPGYRQHMGERFGEFRSPSHQSAHDTESTIWIHAVSLGEMRAAVPLVTALRAAHPDQPLLFTCMTATGREAAESQFGSFAQIAYLPYDFPWAMRALIRRYGPRMLLVIETEIWPNLLATCREADVPALLVNGRLSERSRAGYARFWPVRKLIRDAIDHFSAILAQSPQDAARLASLRSNNSHPPSVTGNLKFDCVPDEALVARGRTWREHIGGRRVLLAASTREGEEKLLLDAYRQQFDDATRRTTLLVIVPRHPQRFDDVFALIAASGFSVTRRSAEMADADDVSLSDVRLSDVWLGDSMNELQAYYAMCDVAFVGGSLVPVGGQNLIEAAALGKPIIMGASDFNFADAAREAREAGALLTVADADQFASAARELLHDEARCAQMSASALAFANTHRGATQKTLAVITATLSAGAEHPSASVVQ
jgi:3-deoxy-D-manno-octulosonic-acid transferase